VFILGVQAICFLGGGAVKTLPEKYIDTMTEPKILLI